TVLAYLFEYEGLKQNQIAAAVGRDKTAINRLIDGLEHKSLVRRQQDPEDKRINQVVLTPQAEQMKARLHRLAADTLAIAWGGVAEADKQATLRVLKQILANVSCSSVFDHVSNLDGLDRPEHPAH
ncbi:MAG: MarR family winged helix-turn-helix transcriptional regulator, partial [Sphingobacteriia bacterium]